MFLAVTSFVGTAPSLISPSFMVPVLTGFQGFNTGEKIMAATVSVQVPQNTLMILLTPLILLKFF
jgi:hypothetical protein